MYEYKANLIRVIDGDTIFVDVDLGFHIHVKSYLRFARINAPELRSKNPIEKEKAKKVKYRVLKLLNNSPIKKIIVRKYGKYQNRYISEIILENGINISDQLLYEGLVSKW